MIGYFLEFPLNNIQIKVKFLQRYMCQNCIFHMRVQSCFKEVIKLGLRINNTVCIFNPVAFINNVYYLQLS